MLTNQNRAILDEIIMPIMAFEEGCITWVNRRARHFLNFKRLEDLSEKNIFAYLDREQIGKNTLASVRTDLAAAFEKKTATSIQIALNIKGFRMETILTVVPDENELKKSGVIIIDGLQNYADKSIHRQSDRMYGELIKKVGIPILICDTMNRVIEINEAFEKLYGYGAREAAGRYFYDLIVPAERMVDALAASHEILSGRLIRKKAENVDKWGRKVEVEYIGHPIFENGRINGASYVFEDLKSKIRFDEEVDLQRVYFEELLNTSPEALVLLDSGDRVVNFNHAFEKLFGYSREEAKGKSINDVVAQGEKRPEAESISKMAMDAEALTTRTVRYHKDKSPIPVELTVNPVVKGTELLGIYAAYKDLTEESRIRQELKLQSEYFKQLFGSSLDAIVLLSKEEKVIDINTAFETLFGYSLKESKGRDINDLVVPDAFLEESRDLRDSVLSGNPRKTETLRKKKNGDLLEVETHGHAITVDGDTLGILVTFKDVRQRMRAMEALEEQKVYFKQLFDNSPEAIVIIDPKDEVMNVNEAFCDLFGYTRSEALGNQVNDLIAPRILLEEAESLSAKVLHGGVVKFETKRRSKSGRLIDVAILAYPVFLGGSQVGGYAIYSDITEKKYAEREIEFLAYRDTLTGLFNRKYFYDELRHKLNCIEPGSKLAVGYIDLNGFKKINDNLGHGVGDELLRFVAKNIEDSLDKEDVVARMGGDEFVFFAEFDEENQLKEKMERIIEKYNHSLVILHHNLNISLSIGVSIYPVHARLAEELVKKADVAMYHAKRHRQSGYRLYDKEIGERNRYNFDLESRLKMALSNEEIRLHYQPILTMEGRLCGCEALMRWDNAFYGNISPTVFIPLAEDIGEISNLGIFVFNRALDVLKKWGQIAGKDFFMSINLSVKQMESPDFMGFIRETLQRHGLEGKNIHLEITESYSAENLKNRTGILKELKNLGFSISIDDFGTGYSSLRQIKNLELDNLKIDRSFVSGIDRKPENKAIVKAIVGMGNSLNLGTIAEGVETEEEMDILKALGCDMFQGYIAQRPGDEKTIEEFIRKHAASSGR